MKSSSNNTAYQHDIFVKDLIQNQTPVSIYLRSGIRLTGKLIGYDESTLLLKDSTYQLIYKEAVGTILLNPTTKL